MYARLTRFRLKVERVEQSIKIFNESILPAAKNQKGYCGIFLFMNKRTGESTSLSFWDSEADCQASEENHYYQEQLIKVMNFLSSPFIREGYPVESYDLNL